MTTQTTKFRYIGITDECVECQACGKVDLRSTVVLAVLDEDGNTESVTYYGSSCAARALGVRGGGRSVLQSARWATDELRLKVKDSRARLDYYSFPYQGGVTDKQVADALPAFIAAHSRAVWAETTTRDEWASMVRETAAIHQSVITDAALIGA